MFFFTIKCKSFVQKRKERAGSKGTVGKVYADSETRSVACLSAQRTKLVSGLAGSPNAKMAVAAPKVKYL